MHMEKNQCLENVAIHCSSKHDAEQALLYFQNNGYSFPSGYTLDALASEYERYPYVAVHSTRHYVTMHSYAEQGRFDVELSLLLSAPVSCKDINMVL